MLGLGRHHKDTFELANQQRPAEEDCSAAARIRIGCGYLPWARPTQEERLLGGRGGGRGSDVAYHPSITNFRPSRGWIRSSERASERASETLFLLLHPHHESRSHIGCRRHVRRRRCRKSKYWISHQSSALLSSIRTALNLVSLHSWMVLFVQQQRSLHIDEKRR